MMEEKEAAPVGGATVSGRGKRYDKRGFAIPQNDSITGLSESQQERLLCAALQPPVNGSASFIDFTTLSTVLMLPESLVEEFFADLDGCTVIIGRARDDEGRV